ncbi:MAG TPA: DUF222 domain-containing protein [Acidimicrobiales bacterium]|nr:DUF222 domain-containing protein [Acidimicrobiales bacterium]
MSVSGTEVGRELVAEWTHIGTCLIGWILKLAEFDRDALWAIDGFTTCASWLEINCAMSRSTAFEKVRVAREVDRRPVVRAAFEAGTLPFSKAQAITRLADVDDARDAKFVADAAHSSVRALELRVKTWNHCNGGDAAPDIDDHYGLRRASGFMDGYGQLVMEGPNDLLDRIVGVVDAYGNFLFHNGPAQLQLHPVDKVSVNPYPQADSEAVPKRPGSARRLDLLVDLFEEVALLNADKIDPETAAIGVTVAYEDLINCRRNLLSSDQESVLTGEAVRRLACDAGIHRLVVKGVSEFLDIGRKTRTWTTPQRRAIRARHAHRCAAEGCRRRITHIHHLQWWENGGTTSIDNGVPLCSYHHHLVHEGRWTITYNPNIGTTRMQGPAGQVLETQANISRLVA